MPGGQWHGYNSDHLHISQLDSLLSEGHLVMFQRFSLQVNWFMCKNVISW